MSSHFIRSIFLGLLTVALSSAASISTSTTCTIGNSTVQGASTCRNLDGGEAIADATATIGISGNTVGLSLWTSVLAGSGTVGLRGSASAIAEASIQFITAGPVRQGIVVGGLSGNVPLNNGAISSTYLATPGIDHYSALYPATVQLGTPLTIVARSTTVGQAGYFDEAAGGNDGFTLGLSFYEADGVTPVALSETPEPGMAGLLSAGLGLIAATLRNRSKRSA